MAGTLAGKGGKNEGGEVVGLGVDRWISLGSV